MLRIGMVALLVLGGCDDTLLAVGDGDTQTTVASDFCGMEQIFDSHCISCHSAASLVAGLDLETDPYGVIVDQPSLTYSNATVVSAGDPEGSLLYAKMTGTQSSDQGGVMPPEGALDDATLQAVHDWISAGALEECDQTITTTSVVSPPDIENEDYCDLVATIDYYCLSCHSTQYAKYYSDLDLEVDPWTALVNVSSAEYYGQTLVIPGASKNSLLWTKVAGVQGKDYGEQMPEDGAMPQQYIDLVATWIDNGATTDCK